MMLVETLLKKINKDQIQGCTAHLCTGAVHFPTLDFDRRSLPSTRLVAVTGRAGGINAAALVEGNT